MTGRSFDAVVVGAGPAGSVAALVLAQAGARVALVDKAAFPRDKACGDLVGPRGVQVLADLGLTVPDAGQGSDLLAVGPSGRASRRPAFPGRSYPGHGVVAPRAGFDHALREAAIAAGAHPVRARIAAVEAGPAGSLRAVVASDGQRLAAGAVIGADGALSPVARLAGMLRPETALWGFAIRAYLPAQVPLPLLVLLDAAPWRIYPGYGWLFPGEDGQANVGIGVGLGSTRRSVPLRDDLARFCGLPARAGHRDEYRPAGLINPLQGEGIGPAMVSARLAAQAVLDCPADPGPGYTHALAAAFGSYLPGASALQSLLLRRPRVASAGVRLITAPGVRRLVAGTWSLYWNGLVDGAEPRPAVWTAALVQRAAGLAAGRGAGRPAPADARSPGPQSGSELTLRY